MWWCVATGSAHKANQIRGTLPSHSLLRRQQTAEKRPGQAHLRPASRLASCAASQPCGSAPGGGAPPRCPPAGTLQEVFPLVPLPLLPLLPLLPRSASRAGRVSRMCGSGREAGSGVPPPPPPLPLPVTAAQKACTQRRSTRSEPRLRWAAPQGRASPWAGLWGSRGVGFALRASCSQCNDLYASHTDCRADRGGQ